MGEGGQGNSALLVWCKISMGFSIVFRDMPYIDTTVVPLHAIDWMYIGLCRTRYVIDTQD